MFPATAALSWAFLDSAWSAFCLGLQAQQELKDVPQRPPEQASLLPLLWRHQTPQAWAGQRVNKHSQAWGRLAGLSSVSQLQPEQIPLDFKASCLFAWPQGSNNAFPLTQESIPERIGGQGPKQSTRLCLGTVR